MNSEHCKDLCAKCGACSVVCPVYQITGREPLSPRGRVHLLKKLSVTNASPALADILSQCLLCGACRDSCPRQVDIPAMIINARQELPTLTGGHPFLKFLARKILAHPILLAGASKTKNLIDKTLLERLPAESGLRLRLGMFCPPLPQPANTNDRQTERTPTADTTPTSQDNMAYFAGCHAIHLDPSISQAVNRIAANSKTNLFLPKGQTCCGLAALSAGDKQEAQRLAQKNIIVFEDNQLPILTSCGSCYAHLLHYPELFPHDISWRNRASAFSNRLQEFSTFFNRLPAKRKPCPAESSISPKRVFYHDPCHLRFSPNITTSPRELISRLPGLTLVELPDGARCCGQGGLFHLAHPELSKKISEQLITPFKSLNADLVVTTCTGCLLQWQQLKSTYNLQVEVLHLATLLDRFGKGIIDPGI